MPADLYEITDAEIRNDLALALPSADTGDPRSFAYVLDQLVPIVRALLERPRPGYTYRARVHRWIDADSCELNIDLGLRQWAHAEPIRLRGINAPDRKPAKDAATRWVRDNLPTHTDLIVRTHKDEDDKYGRLLGDLWLPANNRGEAIFVNDAIVDAGHAQPYSGGTRPVDY